MKKKTLVTSLWIIFFSDDFSPFSAMFSKAVVSIIAPVQ